MTLSSPEGHVESADSWEYPRHSDQPTHVAPFFDHKDFQDRSVWLWSELAKHYKENPYAVLHVTPEKY